MEAEKTMQEKISGAMNTPPTFGPNIEKVLSPIFRGLMEENELNIMKRYEKDIEMEKINEEIANLRGKMKSGEKIALEEISFYSKSLSLKDGKINNPNEVEIDIYPDCFRKNLKVEKKKINLVIFFDRTLDYEESREIDSFIRQFNDQYFIKNAEYHIDYLFSSKILINRDFYTMLTMCFTPENTIYLHFYELSGRIEVDRLNKIWFSHHFCWENLRNWKCRFQERHALYNHILKALESRDKVYVLEDRIGYIDQETGEHIKTFSEINNDEQIPCELIYDGTY